MAYSLRHPGVLWVHADSDGTPPGGSPAVIALPAQPQGEAVTWTPDGDALLVASERDDRLMRVPVPRAPGVETVAATAWWRRARA